MSKSGRAKRRIKDKRRAEKRKLREEGEKNAG